jgi:tetratricopeptide (TPR) repeat protein
VDERINQAERLYEQAVFGGDHAAFAEADRNLDAVEADLALARGRIAHARFVAQRIESEEELGLFERAERIFERLGDVRGQAEALFWTGTYHQVVRGDADTARPILGRALDLARAAGDDLTASYALRHLGILDHRAGRLPEARAQLEESTHLRRRLDFAPGVGANLVGLAYIAAEEGRREAAADLLHEAAALAEETDSHGVMRWISEARKELGLA